MNVVVKKLGVVLGWVLLAMQQSHAMTGGNWTIAYSSGGASTSVPTLSEWALLGLALMVAVFAAYSLRNRAGGRPLASVILACGLALGGLYGNKFVGEARAALSPSTITASSPNPIVFPIVNPSIYTQVVNGTTAVLTITGVSPTSVDTTPTFSPTCVAGVTVLQPGQTCWVWGGGAP